MGNDLERKVILLTGGASGICRECALAYAREGATIAILDRNFEEANGTAKEAGNRSNAYHADVSNGAEIQAAITGVLKEFGRRTRYTTMQGSSAPPVLCTRRPKSSGTNCSVQT